MGTFFVHQHCWLDFRADVLVQSSLKAYALDAVEASKGSALMSFISECLGGRRDHHTVKNVFCFLYLFHAASLFRSDK